MTVDKDDWIINRCEEIAINLTGWEFNTLGPQMQVMCYAKAEMDYADHLATQADAIYDRMKEQQLDIDT